jgi:hypothetical protein
MIDRCRPTAEALRPQENAASAPWGEKLSAESHEIIVGSEEVSLEVLRRRGHNKGTIAPNAEPFAAPAA